LIEAMELLLREAVALEGEMDRASKKVAGFVGMVKREENRIIKKVEEVRSEGLIRASGELVAQLLSQA
jgi:hypothetical protein